MAVPDVLILKSTDANGQLPGVIAMYLLYLPIFKLGAGGCKPPGLLGTGLWAAGQREENAAQCAAFSFVRIGDCCLSQAVLVSALWARRRCVRRESLPVNARELPAALRSVRDENPSTSRIVIAAPSSSRGRLHPPA